MTNGDRIRQMSNEELAKDIHYSYPFACTLCVYNKGGCWYKCIEGIKAYLDSEVE